MPLLGRNEFDASMAIMVVVLINILGNPLAGFFFAAESSVGILWRVFTA